MIKKKKVHPPCEFCRKETLGIWLKKNVCIQCKHTCKKFHRTLSKLEGN